MDKNRYSIEGEMIHSLPGFKSNELHYLGLYGTVKPGRIVNW